MIDFSDLALSSHFFPLSYGHAEKQQNVQEMGKHPREGKHQASVVQKPTDNRQLTVSLFRMVCELFLYSLIPLHKLRPPETSGNASIAQI